MPPTLFMGERCQVSECAVDPAPIVEDLDVVKDAGLGCLSSCIALMMGKFRFEQREEALHGCIIVAVTDTTHADVDLVLGQEPLIVAAGVLATPIRMVQELLCSDGATTKRHGQRLLTQIIGHPCVHGPANDATGKEIHDGGQVEPAFSRGHIRDIRQPDLIRTSGYEILLELIGRRYMSGIAASRPLETAVTLGT